MGTDMGMVTIFENGYGCGYNSTHPVPTPLSSLIQTRIGSEYSIYNSDMIQVCLNVWFIWIQIDPDLKFLLVLPLALHYPTRCTYWELYHFLYKKLWPPSPYPIIVAWDITRRVHKDHFTPSKGLFVSEFIKHLVIVNCF